MTQLSFDAGNRLPLLDITPVSQSGRGGSDSNDDFDSHLNRASSPPPSPAASTTSATSAAPPDSRPARSSSSDVSDSEAPVNQSVAAEQPASDTPDHSDHATASVDDAPKANHSHDKKGDSDREKDHQGEDDVVVSEESAALVQQVVAVTAKGEVKVDETAEGVTNVEATKEKEVPASDKATQPKPKKQLNQSQELSASSGGNKATATEAAKSSTTAEVQATEAPQTVPEGAELDATVVSETPAEEQSAEVAEVKSPTVKPTTTTIKIKDGQTEETLQAAENQAETNEPQAKEASDEKQPEETAKHESATNVARPANAAADSDSAGHAGEQAQLQQEAVAANAELPADMNSGSDASSDQGGANSEQRSDQQTPATSGHKSNAGPNTSAETATATKPLTTPTEAPVLRAENSTSATTSTSGAEATSAADRARFVHRVYRALHVAHERGGEVRLRLSPPELGNLTLELKLHDGAMTAHIEAETSAARTLLLDNLPALKERLAAQDIKVERFDVELRDQSSQQSPNGQPQDSDTSRNTRYVLKRNLMNAGVAADEVASPSVRPTATSGQLNVII